MKGKYPIGTIVMAVISGADPIEAEIVKYSKTKNKYKTLSALVKTSHYFKCFQWAQKYWVEKDE